MCMYIYLQSEREAEANEVTAEKWPEYLSVLCQD